MKGKVAIVTWLAVFWICCSSTWAAPVESEKGKDEFVFLLPATGNGGLIVPGLSVNLEPPSEGFGAFRNARDSYGNPVPPYAAIEGGQKVLTPEGWQFAIPSYASGITEIRKPTNELLPPLVVGEVPVDALQLPAVIQPSIELLPPLKEDEHPSAKKDVITNEITEKSDDTTTVKAESDEKNDYEGKAQEKQPTDNKYGVKYTGGFGGPPGILGEQKERGYAIIEMEEREKEEREKAEREQATTTEKYHEESTEAPQYVTSPPQEKTPVTTSLPPLGFNSVFSSALPPAEVPEKTHTTEDLTTEQPLEIEESSTKPHSEENPPAFSQDSITQIPTTQQPLQTFSFPSFSSPSSNSPTTPQPQQSFPFNFEIPQQPWLPLGSLPTQQPDQPIGSSPTSLSVPSFSSQPGPPATSHFGSPIHQQSASSFGTLEPQQSIASFGSQPSDEHNFSQTANQTQQPIPSFGAPVTEQSIPSIGSQPSQKPTFSQPPNQAQQPIPSFGAPVAQHPIPTFNLSPTSQQLPTYNPLASTQPSFSGRFDSSENPQQAAAIPPSITLTPPNPTPNIFGSAPVPIPASQPQPFGSQQPALAPFGSPQPALSSFGSPQPALSSFGSKANAPGKYTGGFGGAPGVLGNQAKPGYAVQPDGSIRDPDYAYKLQPAGSVVATSTTTTTTTKAPIIVTPITKYEKYTGGFGGPPGFLTPHDNKH